MSKITVKSASRVDSDSCITSISNANVEKFGVFPLHQEDANHDASNVSSNWSNCGRFSMNIIPSGTSVNELLGSHPPSHTERPLRSNGVNYIANRDVETLSRLYKKELLTQICCYVLAFCLTTLPVIILFLRRIAGGQESANHMRIIYLLKPLAGFFNIIIYTRWNVRSYKRKHPESSWIRAFCLILKAGGGLPEEEGEDITGDSSIADEERNSRESTHT